MTERTGGKRPDYSVLHKSGECVIIDATSSRQSSTHEPSSFVLRPSSLDSVIQHTDRVASSTVSSGSSPTNTSTLVEAQDTVSRISLPESGSSTEPALESHLSLTDTKELTAPVSDISNQSLHLSLDTAARTNHQEDYHLAEVYQESAEEGVITDNTEAVIEVSEGSSVTIVITDNTEAVIEISEGSSVTIDSTDSDAEKMAEALESLKVQAEVLAADIDDYVDENPIAEIRRSVEDLDAAVRGAETVRSAYRAKHKELARLCPDQVYKDEFSLDYDERIEIIKKYIMSAKEQR